MSWSYSGDPSSSETDECRFLVGDTDINEPVMQDEEIQYLITNADGNRDLLMYNLFIRAATLFARDIKRTLGPQSEDPSGRLQYFKEQATAFKSRLTCSGLSIPNWQHPKVFSIGMQNNPPYTGGD